VTKSAIYFPLRSNAAGLVAGGGVALVRRRIIIAGLLHDAVNLEQGFHLSWAGPDGSSSMTSHSEQGEPWQTTFDRRKRTGAVHHFAMRLDSAPADTPMRAMIVTPASFSWRATFEPFRQELPASAASWLHFGWYDDSPESKQLVRDWETADRMAAYRRDGLKPRRAPAQGQFVRDKILDGAYNDLALAAIARVGVSLDRRHHIGVQARLAAGDAKPVGGQYALDVLFPIDIGWGDVPELRAMRGFRDYVAVVRELEQLSLADASTLGELDDRIKARYRARVAKAAEQLAFGGRVTMATISLVVGAAAGVVNPGLGVAAAAGSFVAQEAIGLARQPRWMSVHRRLYGRLEGV
jgi:hypothetical protein